MKDQEFEQILYQALRQEIAPEEIAVHVRYSGKGTHMNMKKLIKKTCIAAAVILLLTTTAYASGALNIKTLLSGGGSRTYETVEQAEEKAGFHMDSLTEFANGYIVSGVRVDETKALDKDDRVRLTYHEIHVDLRNGAGEKLNLVAHEYHDGIKNSDFPPEQTRRIGETVISYRVDHYKFVPADYVQTEADKAMLQQPGYFMSYGAEEVRETDAAFLSWEKDGVCYLIMDSDASEPTESLFSMAEELILDGM